MLNWDAGELFLEEQSPWPGPRVVAWASAPARYNKLNDAEKAELRGPQLAPTGSLCISTSKSWREFTCGQGFFGSAYRSDDASLVAHAGVDHYTVADLKPGTKYYFHLRTINEDAPGGSTEAAIFSEKTKSADK